MLQRLVIRDFVLADRLELEFATGSARLPARRVPVSRSSSMRWPSCSATAPMPAVRSGCEQAEVSAEFEVATLPAVTAWLRDNEMEADGELILRRTLDAGGRSRVWINGSPSTVQQLREISESLVDIHGQHAHQSLLRADAQRALLDDHADLGESVAAVAGAWRAWRDAAASLAAATGGAEALLREREELIWQVGEIEALAFFRPTVGNH